MQSDRRIAKRHRQKQPFPWRPILAIVGVGLGIAYAAFLLMRPSVLARHLSVRPSVQQMKDGDELAINDNKPGVELDVRGHYVRGKYTIVDFSSEHCPSCLQIGPSLLELTKYRPDIAVRSVDVDRPGSTGIDWFSPVCKQYHIGSLPAFRIYGPNGSLLAEGRTARREISNILDEEVLK